MNGMSELARTPEVIAAEINSIKAQTREFVCRNAIEIGKKLREVKARVPFGKWAKWLAENVDYSERTAQDLMKLFEEYGNANPQAIADLSKTQALMLTRLDCESREQLLEEKDVPGMSTRDLQEEIDRINEERRKQQITIDSMLAARAEADDERERVRADLEEERAASGQMREALDRAKSDAELAMQRAADAVERANAEAQENAQLRAALKAEQEKPEPHPIIQQVEVVPQEVAEELDALRKKTSERSEMVVLLRESYRELVAKFEVVLERIENMEASQPEEAARYRSAVATAARRMAEKLEG